MANGRIELGSGMARGEGSTGGRIGGRKDLGNEGSGDERSEGRRIRGGRIWGGRIRRMKYR